MQLTDQPIMCQQDTAKNMQEWASSSLQLQLCAIVVSRKASRNAYYVEPLRGWAEDHITTSVIT